MNTSLNVRMTQEEYNKIKEDAVKLGFGTKARPGISDYIRFISKNIKIDVKLQSDLEKKSEKNKR